MRDRYEVLYLERLSGRTSVPVVSTVGTRLPMHSTGVGKVLLAHAPDDVVDVVMANLTRVTPYSVTQPRPAARAARRRAAATGGPPRSRR